MQEEKELTPPLSPSKLVDTTHNDMSQDAIVGCGRYRRLLFYE